MGQKTGIFLGLWLALFLVGMVWLGYETKPDMWRPVGHSAWYDVFLILVASAAASWFFGVLPAWVYERRQGYLSDLYWQEQERIKKFGVQDARKIRHPSEL